MSCGQKCKEIIDQWNATVQAGSCMVASILLTSTTSSGPPPEMVAEFRARCEAVAKSAQAIASHLTPSG